jgi:aminoglycoside 6'-N-acetyltransferase
MDLRPARPSDEALLRGWDAQAHVIASNPNDHRAWEVELNREPDWCELLIAEIDDRPIGFMQIIDPAFEQSRYWGKLAEGLRAIDIWIGEEGNLGKGYGTEMMKLALTRCFSDAAVSTVIVDPLVRNVRAHHFYERLGFQFVERRWFGADECLIYRLHRAEFARAARGGAGAEG